MGEKAVTATYTDFMAPGVILHWITVIQSALPGWQEVPLVWEHQTSDMLCICAAFPTLLPNEQPKMLPSAMQNAPKWTFVMSIWASQSLKQQVETYTKSLQNHYTKTVNQITMLMNTLSLRKTIKVSCKHLFYISAF